MSKRFASGVHLDIDLVGGFHVVYVLVIERYQRKFVPKVFHWTGAVEFFFKGIEHGQHTFHRRVVIPRQDEVGMLFYFLGELAGKSRLEVTHQEFTEPACGVARFVAEPFQELTLGVFFFVTRREPVQQIQCGEPLLAIQRNKGHGVGRGCHFRRYVRLSFRWSRI